MALFKIENLSFKYEGEKDYALHDVSFDMNKGETLAVIGRSGCGKSTLLRLMKKSVSPKGELFGRVIFSSDDISKTGFVFQNPFDQSVCETVYDEICFAPQNLGISSDDIRRRTAEVCEFFGITDMVTKKMSELSGGEVQLVNLAAVSVLSPEVIILDEPYSQLDPISCDKLTGALRKLKDELGTSIVISSHSLENVLPLVDKVLVLDAGRVSDFGKTDQVFLKLLRKNDPLCLAAGPLIPLCKDKLIKTVKQAREYIQNNGVRYSAMKPSLTGCGDTSIFAKNVYFRYDKKSDDILKDISLKIKKGRAMGLCGANGSGKTTLMKVLAELRKPYAGRVKSCGGSVYLPQDARLAFVKDSVLEDIKFMCEMSEIDTEEIHRISQRYAIFNKIDRLFSKHPYDLSGGELQLAALFKALVCGKSIIFLDEPAKGFDPYAKADFISLINEIKKNTAVVISSHDIELLTEVCDDISMLFGGEIICFNAACEFVFKNSFFTTALARASRGICDGLALSSQLGGAE